MIRTTAPTKENKNYDWNASTLGQCTWYCYGRAYEEFKAYPTWWSREQKTGKYPNAKNWDVNYRDPWEFKSKDYIPTHGDIVICDGTYGHVFFIEENKGDGTCLISQYNLDAPETFSTAIWTIGNVLVGKKWRTGKVKGYLHYPSAEPIDYKLKYEALLADMKKIREVASKYE